MLHNKQIHIVVLFAFIATMQIRCSINSPVAGATDLPNETRAGIHGIITDTSGQPVANARIVLNRYEVALPDIHQAVDSTRSDALGKYFFTKRAPGNYSIVATAANVALINFSSSIVVSDSLDSVGVAPLALEPQTTVTGTVGFSVATPLDLSVYLVGTPYRTTVNNTGAFVFSNVPVGKALISAVVRTQGTNGVLAGLDSILCQAGSTTLINPINLFTLPSPCTIDNFESGSGTNQRGQIWWGFDDAATGGKSRNTASFRATPGAGASNYCAHLSIMFDTTIQQPYCGMGIRLTHDYTTLETGTDLNNLKSISFDCKGSGHHLEFAFYSGLSNNYLHVLAVNPVPSTWTHHTFSIQSITAFMSPQDRQRWLSGNRFISQLVISLTRDTSQMPATGDLWIDNIEFQFN